MTDEQRKQIEDKRVDIKSNPKDYGISENFADLASVVFGWGCEFSASFSDNRVKELEDVLKEVLTFYRRSSDIEILFDNITSIIPKVNQLLTPTDNDKEQKG